MFLVLVFFLRLESYFVVIDSYGYGVHGKDWSVGLLVKDQPMAYPH